MSSRRSRLLGLAATALLALAVALPAAAAPAVDVELDFLSLNGPMVHPGQVTIMDGDVVAFRGPVPEDGIVRLRIEEPALQVVFEGETFLAGAGPDARSRVLVKFDQDYFEEARNQVRRTGDSLRVVWAPGGETFQLEEVELEEPSGLRKSGGPAPPPPSNDDCMGASPLAIGPAGACTDTVFSMVDATDDGMFSCDTTTNNRGVWFSFVAPATGGVLLDTDNSAEIAVFEASCMGLEVYCSTISTASTEIVAGLTPGETYYMVFWEDGTPSSSPYTLCAQAAPPPPPNDDCAAALDIAVGETVSGQSFAGGIDDSPDCGLVVDGAGVWYTVIGTGKEMRASASTDFSGFDIVVDVLCADCDDLTCVGQDDGDGTGPSTADVTWCSQMGATYRVLVWDDNGPGGPFDLTVTEVSAEPCQATVRCLPEGACCTCLDDYYCRITTEGTCRALGGKYRGDDTTCLIEQGGSFVDVSSDGASLVLDLGVVSSTIFVPDSLSIATAEVTVNITMDYVDETLIYLESPSGTIVVLMNEPESPSTCTILGTLDTTFADDGDQFSDCPDLEVGNRINPVSANGSPLSALAGEDAMGAWRLWIDDTVGSIASSGDNGLLNFWTLRLVDEPPVKVDNCLNGNNGLGNGLDPQPNGDPKPNDIPGDDG